MGCFPLEGSTAKIGEQELEIDDGMFVPIHGVGCLDTTLKLPEGEEPHDASTVLTIEDDTGKIVVDVPTLWGDRFWAFEAGPEVTQGELLPKVMLAGFAGDEWPRVSSTVMIDARRQCDESWPTTLEPYGDQLQFPILQDRVFAGCGSNSSAPALPFGVHVIHEGGAYPPVARCEGVRSCTAAILVHTETALNVVR